jgi:hypothetical protein
MTLVRHLVVADEVENGALATAIDAILRSAADAGLRLSWSGSEDISRTVVRSVYTNPARSAELSVVSDTDNNVRYLALVARTADELETLAQAASAEVPARTLDELRSEAEQSVAEDPQALIRLAIGAPERFDAETARVIVDSFASEQDVVRFRAVEAASLIGWPEFAEPLRTIAASDRNEGVRAMAAEALTVSSRGTQ